MKIYLVANLYCADSVFVFFCKHSLMITQDVRYIFSDYLLPYKMNTKSTLCDKTEERKPGGSELSAYDLSVLNMKQF